MVTEIDVNEALSIYEDMRVACGFNRGKGAWITEGNPKLNKNRLHTLGNSYMPARTGYALAVDIGLPDYLIEPLRLHNACPRATKGCMALCLNTAGRGAMNAIQRSRLARTLVKVIYPDAAYTLDQYYLRKAKAKYGAHNIARRFNVISDYDYVADYPKAYWTEHYDVIHYDYTKQASRVWDSVSNGEWIAAGSGVSWPAQYSLIYSASERDTVDSIRSMVRSGVNVAIVVDTPKGMPKPTTWAGLPAIDGDITDERYDDPRGVVVLLTAKGKAKKMEPSMGGFVKLGRVA